MQKQITPRMRQATKGAVRKMIATQLQYGKKLSDADRAYVERHFPELLGR